MEGQRWSSDVYYLDLRIWVSDSGGCGGLLRVTLAIGVWILPVYCMYRSARRFPLCMVVF